MENLLNPKIKCTDPDQLQFCLKKSGEEFWYCEPNWYNDKLLPDAKTEERKIIQRYLGNPNRLLNDIKTDEKLKDIILDRHLWLSGSSEIDDFTEEEKHQLLDTYGYSWDDFDNDADRNQIICEIYFEQNPIDFRNDI